MNYGDSRPSQLAVLFFLISCLVLFMAGMTGYLLHVLFPCSVVKNGLSFPPVFYFSTLSLMLCSVLLNLSIQAVQREKQKNFRFNLVSALCSGTLFLGMQCHGLYCVLQQSDPTEAATGAVAFAFVCAVLHGFHATVAQFFLIYVTLLSCASRYDHEYYWGVRYCAIFWHGLGIIWIIIFFIFLTIS